MRVTIDDGIGTAYLSSPEGGRRAVVRRRKSFKERINEPYSELEDLIYGSIWAAIIGFGLAWWLFL